MIGVLVSQLLLPNFELSPVASTVECPPLVTCDTQLRKGGDTSIPAAAANHVNPSSAVVAWWGLSSGKPANHQLIFCNPHIVLTIL